VSQKNKEMFRNVLSGFLMFRKVSKTTLRNLKQLQETLRNLFQLLTESSTLKAHSSEPSN
jgi:hypothetical protein